MNAEIAYLFRHALLRDAAYQLQLPSTRGRLHFFAAQVLEPLARRDSALAEELADHYAAARNLAGLRHAPREQNAISRAARHCANKFRNADGARYWASLAALAKGEVAAQAELEQGLLLSGINQFDAALRALQSARKNGSTRTAFEALIEWSKIQISLGNPRSAIEQATKSLALARRGQDPNFHARALDALAAARKAGGDLNAAKRLYGRALKLQGLSGAVRSMLQGNLAGVFLSMGDLARAEALQLQSLKSPQSRRDPRKFASATGRLAIILQNSGRAQQAERLHHETLQSHVRTGNRMGEANALANLGAICQVTSRMQEAAQLMRRAIGIYREIGARRNEGLMLTNLANLHYLQSDHAAAAQMFETALAFQAANHDRRSHSITLGNYASLLHDMGKFPEAVAAFDKAISELEGVGDRRGQAIALGNKATLLRKLDRANDALQQLNRADSLIANSNDLHTHGSAQCERALCLLALGSFENASDSWAKGSAALREAGDTDSLARMESEMQELCRAQGIEVLK